MLHLSKVVKVFISLSILIGSCRANNHLQTKYEWKQIDFNYESADERQAAIDNQTFIPANVIPTGLDVHQNRLFLSLPRLKTGVPASLAYINLDELTESNAPVLKPYPSWQAHRMLYANDTPDIVSPFHIKVDRCNRLWALDVGIENQLNESESRRLAPPRLLVYDLRNDNVLRQYELPKGNFEKSIFSNVVVEDDDCDDTFVYLADSGASALLVYSWKLNESWQVKHNFFSMDPLAGNFSILGVNYRTAVGLYGLALSEKKSTGFADLYFHPLTSTNEFNISTQILRNSTLVRSGGIYNDFTVIGSRGVNAQAGASVMDQSNSVIFYTLPNMNEIACWKTSNKNYSIDSGNVFSSPVKMVYPIDVKIDEKKHLWVLSNNLQQFINGDLNPQNINFYVHYVAVSEAIKGTACEAGFIEKVVNKFNKALRPGSGSSGSAVIKPVAVTVFVLSILLLAMQQH